MRKYTSTIKTRGFLYLEAKKASALYLQGFSAEEIKKKALEENIFLMKTENRRKEIAVTVLDRISVLDDFLLKKLVDGNLETGKQIVLYSILKTDRLFFEFMQEVYREKFYLRDYIITDRDFSAFFLQKTEQCEQLASLTDYTFYKLSQVYKKILMEAGLANKNKKILQINRPIMEQDVTQHIINTGGQVFLETMLKEV